MVRRLNRPCWCCHVLARTGRASGARRIPSKRNSIQNGESRKKRQGFAECQNSRDRSLCSLRSREGFADISFKSSKMQEGRKHTTSNNKRKRKEKTNKTPLETKIRIKRVRNESLTTTKSY
jgi:hypothetical protein